jgi:hypothetical protein
MREGGRILIRGKKENISAPQIVADSFPFFFLSFFSLPSFLGRGLGVGFLFFLLFFLYAVHAAKAGEASEFSSHCAASR